MKENNLIIQYMPLVKNIASKIYRKSRYYFEYGDLVQYGSLGLLNAIRKYDKMKSNNSKPKTYFYICIHGSIIDGMREENKYRPETKDIINKFSVSYIPDYFDDKIDKNYNYNIEDDFFKKEDIKEMIVNFSTVLSSVEQKIFMLYYWERMTLSKIGKLLGFTESRASQIHMIGLKKLRGCYVN